MHHRNLANKAGFQSHHTQDYLVNLNQQLYIVLYSIVKKFSSYFTNAPTQIPSHRSAVNRQLKSINMLFNVICVYYERKKLFYIPSL